MRWYRLCLAGSYSAVNFSGANIKMYGVYTMTTTAQAAPQPRSWLRKAGVAAGVLLGLAALRWLPTHRRRTKIAHLRRQALKLTERLMDTAQERF